MAISVYDVRDTFARPRLALPSRGTAGTTRRRVPVAAVATGLLSFGEAVALLAGALQGVGGLLTGPSRPAGPVLGLVLLVLAAWIVLAAGSGAAVMDGSGRRLLVGVATAELLLVAVLAVAATVTSIASPVALPLPELLVVAAAVPLGKLLLSGSPSVQAWLAAGPPAVEHRPDPATTHRVLATATLGVIGLALGAVALLGPVEDSVRTGETATAGVFQP